MKDNDAVTFQVNEDIALVQHMKSVFAATQWAAPKPALSQLSTSNSATSLEHYTNRKELEDEMDSDSSTSNTNSNSNSNAAGGGEPSELIMQLELSEDIRLGSRSPDDTSNNFLPLPHSPPPHFHIHPPPLGIQLLLLCMIVNIKTTLLLYMYSYLTVCSARIYT